MKNAFSVMVKLISFLKCLCFCPDFVGYVEKHLDKKAKVNFKINDITDWTKNNYNACIVQYLKKYMQLHNQISAVNRI